MRRIRRPLRQLAILCGLVTLGSAAPPYPVIQPTGSMILDTTDLAQCVEDFNEEDRWFFGVASDIEVSAINNGVYGGQFVLNGDAYDYLKDQIPLFDCPDPEFVKTYYFRWWTYRKHIKNLGSQANPDLIVTEFIDPVWWADSTNAINAPLGHQLYEGRWLHDGRVMEDYQRYWMTNPAARPRNYSAWLADGVFANQKVNPDSALMLELLTSSSNLKNLTENYDDWVNGVGTGGGASRRSDGLFWQNDDRDAMEVSFGGSGRRPSINSYMFADARAIAAMYRVLASEDPGNTANYNALADFFDQEAESLRDEVQDHLWDPADEFFKTGYNDFDTGGTLHGRREQIGFTPWAFGLPEDGGPVDFDRAWTHLGSFSSSVGLTSGALDEAGYNAGSVGQCCRWDGPVWPYATSITLRGLGNLLQDYQQGHVDKSDYFQQLEIYTDSHRQEFTQNGQTRTISWIDESMVSGGANAGNWTQIGITRDGATGNDNPRGLAYNHSGYVDLIITGLVGLRPDSGELVRVSPLVPDNGWDWFLLDHVLYHGRYLTILWDRDGTKYGRGAGLKVYADGGLIASAPDLQEVVGTLATTNDTLLISSNPPDNATDLFAGATTLEATFNRVVQPGSGTIRLMRSTGSGDVLVESFDVATSSRLSFEAASVRISPTAALLASADYHVLVDATAIEGESGSFFAGISDATTWNFSTDSTAPSIVDRTPAPGSPAVSTQSDLSMQFDELVERGAGNVVIKRASDDVVVQTVGVNSPEVLVDGDEVTVLLADLPVDTFYVEMDAGAFSDRSGNPFAGISGSLEWTFTTSATAGVISVSLFDEPTDLVNTGGPVHSACHFQNPSEGDPSPLVVNGIPHVVGRNTPSNLTQNMGFEGDFRDGASGLPTDGSDVVQVLLSGIAGANGITMSISGLTVGQEYLFQAYWEANGTNPQQSLTMTFENDSLSGVGPQGIPGGVLISYSFTASDTTLNAFVDRDDGATTGDQNNWLSGYSLQEVPTTGGPELNSTEPTTGATEFPVAQSLVANFNKSVQAGVGSVALYRSDDSLVEALNVNDTTPPGIVTFSGSAMTIDPSAPLEGGTSYYILIGASAVTDDLGNPFDGISSKAEWSFTADGNPPVKIGMSPLNGAIDLPVSTDLGLSFNEAMAEGAGNFVVRRVSDDGVEQTVSVASPAVVITDTEVAISLADLPAGSYYVEIDNGALVDLSGNPYAGISGSSAWSFTTSATSGAIVVSLLDEESDIVKTGGPVVSAVHFQDPSEGDPSPLVVSGIPHIVGQANEPLLNDNISFEGDFRNGASGLPQDGSDIVQVLLSGIGGNNGLALNISGLTVGTEYLFQAYWEANNTTPQHSLVATIEGEVFGGISPQGTPGGVLISRRFVAGDGVLNTFFDRDDGATSGSPNNWLSGYSLQEIPGGANYADWIAGFPSVGAQTGFNDDPDGDKLANGVEAWLGSDPGVFNTGLEGLSSDGTTTTFSHSRNPSPPSDVSGAYEWSLDLDSWYDGDGSEGPVGGPNVSFVPVTVDSTTSVTATASEAIERLFVRIAVTQE